MKTIVNRFVLLFGMFILMTSEAFAKELTPAMISSLIRPIEASAIVYGEGSIKAYVFIDPNCPHSRDFISMIHDNAKMRSIYRYYLFFYELKRFNSHNLIGSIYSSTSPLQKTLEVMVGNSEINELKTLSPKIEDQIDQIDHVAQTLGVNRRPYLIINKE